jgi:hypothetical protein
MHANGDTQILRILTPCGAAFLFVYPATETTALIQTLLPTASHDAQPVVSNSR